MHCVDCSTGSDWAATAGVVIGALALVATAIGLFLALRALRASTAAVELTRKAVAVGEAQLKIDREQQDAAMEERARSARFDVTPQLVGADDGGTLHTTGSMVLARLEIGLDNTRGTRAAGRTGVNVLAPVGLLDLKWCGADGRDIDRTSRETLHTSETLTYPDGRTVESDYLHMELEEVPIIGHRVFHVQWSQQCPTPGEYAIPLRIKVWADEADEQVAIEFVARIVRDPG